MAAGDVTVQIVDVNATAIDTAVTAMRVTANDKWLMTSIANGFQVCIVHIEEA
jgi:hypothetical protein|tara:strand:- start:125 stop:283 length:159 start_codon:yes stop_codon:yes gene_type:complete